MNAKLQHALLDLLRTLGLLERPTLQPIPVRSTKPAPQPEDRRRR
ncbi:PA1414 family protein [Pseudomonas sp. MIL19]|uniref:PA1414 family protein n=2 Tax=Pseudomonas spirodelae TaxID=3101751 RepID=A0ABU5P960_9PSED|nr:PA1414 family protein [Pseudomonas sp. T5W1]MEA1606090.1 PA1414 family protein [Pseudomonas sp. T5W1]